MSDQASTIMVNTLEPQSGTTLTVGKSGQNLQVNADSLKANVLKDAGGNAIFTSNGSGTLSGLNSAFGSAQTLISTTTVSSAVASIAFTSGIDSTYKEYVFEFINMNPATDQTGFQFNAATDGSTYDVIKTTTVFAAYHAEDNTSAGLGYEATWDLAQSTAYQTLANAVTNDADMGVSGVLHLLNPASTTYVKNWYVTTVSVYDAATSQHNDFIAGYFNTTTALNAIDFKFSSGNINAGKIKMYGIS